MRETVGIVVIVLAAASFFGFSDVTLCLHTPEKSYCTAERTPAQKDSK